MEKGVKAIFGLMEQNGTKQNRLKWSGMERSGTTISIHCLDML
jgi:hypothetical protein